MVFVYVNRKKGWPYIEGPVKNEHGDTLYVRYLTPEIKEGVTAVEY